MPKRIMYLVATKQYFLSHRKSLASFVMDNGYEVLVATDLSHSVKDDDSGPFEYFNVNFYRNSLNPIKILASSGALIKVVVQTKPDLLHAVALKPILVGLIVSAVTRTPLVATIAGLGLTYTKIGWKYKLVRFLLEFYLKMMSKLSRVNFIFQNPDDKGLMMRKGVVNATNSSLILSSGVNLEKFKLFPRTTTSCRVVLFPSRMVRSKGVEFFVETARILKKEFSDVRFVLAGEPDLENRDSVSVEMLQKWVSEGVVEWIGFQKQMVPVFKSTDVVVFPSFYREGIPLCLVEACAAGCAIVTFDMPGCRETVKNGWNGFLVKCKDQLELNVAVRKILSSEELMKSFMENSLKMAEDNFDMAKINAETLACYEF